MPLRINLKTRDLNLIRAKNLISNNKMSKMKKKAKSKTNKTQSEEEKRIDIFLDPELSALISINFQDFIDFDY